MTMTRQGFLRLALVASIAPAGAGLAFGQQGDILVGATVPITGPLSSTGKQYHNALQIAEQDIDAAGGISGRKVKFVFEDTQASNGTAVNAFMKLAQETKPSFYCLSSCSTQNLAVSPELKKIGAPAMYAGGNDWLFRGRPADAISARGMVEAARLPDAKKPGIIFIQNDFGQGGAQVAARQFEAAGTPVVGMEAYGQNDEDFSAQMLIDEPSLGPAPRLAEEVYERIRQIAAAGLTILVVEQNTVLALAVADRGYVLE